VTRAIGLAGGIAAAGLAAAALGTARPAQAGANFRVTIPAAASCGASAGGTSCVGSGAIDVPHVGAAAYSITSVHVSGFPYGFDPATGLWTSRQSTRTSVTFTNDLGTLTLSGSAECVSSAADPGALMGCDSGVTAWTAAGTGKFAAYDGAGGFGSGVFPAGGDLSAAVTFVGRLEPAPPR
jgi:hypothetical protein